MKKTIILFLVLLFNFYGKAQNIDTITTLDSFFAGIPVKQGFAKWVEYLYKHPHLGLDSANNRGSYSSLKPGIKSHFPFPDSVQVKILAEDKLIKIPGIDTLIRQQELLIQASFNNSKVGKKYAWRCFEELKKIFKSYYKKKNSFDDTIYYSKGITTNFPPFVLLIEYAEKSNSYKVIMRTGEEIMLATKK